MRKLIQIRNVPEGLHRRVKARAAMAGMSMSEYVLAELERAMAKPTRGELIARLAEMEPVDVDTPPADLIRQERDRL